MVTRRMCGAGKVMREWVMCGWGVVSHGGSGFVVTGVDILVVLFCCEDWRGERMFGGGDSE